MTSGYDMQSENVVYFLVGFCDDTLLFRVALNSNNSQKHNYALYNLNINIYLTLNLYSIGIH
jgi:hypothetical protein